MWPEYKISSCAHPLQQVLLKCWTCNWCLWNPVPHKLFWKCWSLNSMPSSVTLDTVYILRHTKISKNRKRRKQHVFILLNKILGAELYRVINNTMVSAGMVWAQEISLINQCAMNWPWLNWCLFENTKCLWVDSEFLIWYRSQKERWKVKNVSCILSRALSLEWWTGFSNHIPELVWCVILGSDATKCNVFLPSPRSVLQKGHAAVYSASALEEMAQWETLDQQGKRWF